MLTSVIDGKVPETETCFWFGCLVILIKVLALLIEVWILYLTHVFHEFVLPATKIVIVEGSVHQIYTSGRGTGYCTSRPLVTTIALGSMKFPTGRLVGGQSGGLAVSWGSLGFIFERLRGFFFIIGPPILPITRTHFTNSGKGLELRLGFGFNGFIKNFVLGVQFLVPTIYLSVDKWP